MKTLSNGKSSTIVVLFAALVFTATPTLADELRRESRSAAGLVSERAQDSRRDPSKPALDRSDASSSKRARRSALQSASNQVAVCCTFRIYSAGTELFDDFDDDGYYTYLRINFDVDTDFASADVYANLYLASPYEDWELFFESEVFTLFGSSPDDEYEVETEFVRGYPPDDYDVLIEIYDAVDGSLVASAGPAESSALSLLPIEDIDFDSEFGSPSDSSAGSASLLTLVTGFIAIGIRRRTGNCLPFKPAENEETPPDHCLLPDVPQVPTRR